MKTLVVRGARTHNLRSVDVDFPRGKLVVITGPSGSGKSSLAFDTLYAEGQRRFIESLSAYARQFLPRLPKPDVDLIEGLSPSMCVRQESLGHNPRSTVGTVTEVVDFVRLMFARLGTPHSPATGKPLRASTRDQMIQAVLALPEGQRFSILAPVLRGHRGALTDTFEGLRRAGFVRVRVDGRVVDLADPGKLAPRRPHDLDVVVDRLVAKPGARARVADSVELALRTGLGRMLLAPEVGDEVLLTERYECSASGYVFPPLEPRFFSFNSVEGACPSCGGLGREPRAFTDRSDEGDDTDVAGPPAQALDDARCAACDGTRLRPEARLVRLAERNIAEVCAMPVAELRDFVSTVEAAFAAAAFAAPLLREVRERVDCLASVGLDYLSLDRGSATLSSGEAQRVQLATQIGAHLSGVLYVLDEPSVGLHPRDTQRLIETLRTLRDRDNTVIVVEHDLAMLRAADYVLELGPGAGDHGGRVIAEGPLDDVLASAESVGAPFLRGDRHLARVRARRTPTAWLHIRHAARNNLANLSADVPLGVFAVVTGVSGSGKSTLVLDTLIPALHARAKGAAPPGGAEVTGLEHVARTVAVDASPIGRSSRSCPATYVGILGPLRELFAQTPEARARGYGPSRFSFNVRGGRCEACQGTGVTRIPMHFLPDVEVTCEVCEGRRFASDTLEVRVRGLHMADVLALTVDDAEALFRSLPDVHGLLGALRDVGLGYLTLGQPATTLSGGEAQRLKLAVELGRRASVPTLYVFDEPTTGLHFVDVDLLLSVFDRLVEAGHSVLVIEHHPDVIASADHVIELGPEAGVRGGRLVAQGTPEVVATTAGSPTAPFIAEVLAAYRNQAR